MYLIDPSVLCVTSSHPLDNVKDTVFHTLNQCTFKYAQVTAGVNPPG